MKYNKYLNGFQKEINLIIAESLDKQIKRIIKKEVLK